MSTTSSERPSALEGDPAPTPATPGLLRSINDRVVLDLLLEHKTLSRTDVRRLTGVSKPTASQLLTRLEDSGHVVASGYQDSDRGGRASRIYELNPTVGTAAAIDVTPAGFHVQVADVRGTVIADRRVPQQGEASTPHAAIDALSEALAPLGKAIGDLSSIVIAAPGSFDTSADELRYAGTLSQWQRPGIVAELTGLTGVPVFIENDVNLVAVAEHRLGAVRSVEDFFLFWVDEGIGGALMIGDRLYRGSTGGAGEIAFLQLPGAPVVTNPVRENLGGFDHLAGEAELRAIAQRLDAPGASAPEIVALAAASPDGRPLLDELARRYAVGLASVIALFDPAVVVLAGSVMVAGGDALLSSLTRQVEELAITVPRLALGTVEVHPVVTGALLVSLDHTRAKVFTT